MLIEAFNSMEDIRWAGKKRKRSSDRRTKQLSRRSSMDMVAERFGRRKSQLSAGRIQG
jgi:hypothetical protein